jgi:hypothetical protein
MRKASSRSNQASLLVSQNRAGSAARRTVAYDPRNGFPRMKLRGEGKLLRGEMSARSSDYLVVDPLALDLYDKRTGMGRHALWGEDSLGDRSFLYLLSPKDARAIQLVGGFTGDALRESMVDVHLPEYFPGKRFAELVDAIKIYPYKIRTAMFMDDLSEAPPELDEVRWLSIILGSIGPNDGNMPAVALNVAAKILREGGLHAWANGAGQISIGEDEFDGLYRILKSTDGDERLVLTSIWLLSNSFGEMRLSGEDVDRVRGLAEGIDTQHLMWQIQQTVALSAGLLPFGWEVPLVGKHRLKDLVRGLSPEGEQILLRSTT